jgi:hypothetical protein
MSFRRPVLVVACLLLLGACRIDTPKLFFIDPDKREFELPPHPQILIFVDGLRADVLEELRAAGKLPRLDRYLFDRAARVRTAVDCIPSVTYANAMTMLTGCWPSSHGVWANVCFDREALQARDFEAATSYVNDDVARPTIFELLHGELTASVAMTFARGSKISLATSAGTGGEMAGIAWLLGQEEFTDELLSEELEEVGADARRCGEWPAFIGVHLPAVDGVAHESGSDGEAYRAAIENLDQALGEVLESFARGGMLDELTIVLTSDHGHHTTPRALALDVLLQGTLDMPVLLCTGNDEGLGYLARWERCSTFQAIATITGEREASLHLRTGRCWRDRPTFEEILAFPACAGERPQTLPELLLLSPAIDLVAVRAGEHEVRLFGHEGSASIRRTRGEDGALFRYTVFHGQDPLGYGAELRAWSDAGPHTSREWLEATAGERHPDAVPQLMIAFDHPRSGDLMLFAAPAWDFSSKYAGGHGGIEREEMVVPLYIAGPGIRAGAEVPAARLVDLVPTLLELSGHAASGERFDGVSFARALR